MLSLLSAIPLRVATAGPGTSRCPDCSAEAGKGPQPGVLPVSLAASVQAPKEAVCAICGVREKAGPEPVAAIFDYQGKTYYYCREACRTEFRKNPEQWIRAAQAPGQGLEGVTRPAQKPEGEKGHQQGSGGVGPAGAAGGGQSAAPS